MKPTKCPAREKKMRQEKRKKKGGEKAKSKSQDYCVTFKQAGTKVGLDQLGPPVRVGSTRIDSDQLGSNKKIKIK